MNEHSQKTEKQGRAGVVRAVLLLVVIPLLLAGVSYAWLYSGTDIQTLLKLQPPSNISILEPDENKSLDLIRLDTQNGTKSKDGKTITFRQPFRVRSDCKFRLEIAHTTNLRGLSFKLYKSGEGTDTANASEENTNAITVVYNGKTYTSTKVLDGDYINQKNPETQNPETKNEYKFADDSLHGKVYTDKKDEVQAHAEPLFWLVNDAQGKNITDSTPAEYYYILEASWTEETSKETDLFYILAARAPEGEASSGSQTGDATDSGE